MAESLKRNSKLIEGESNGKKSKKTSQEMEESKTGTLKKAKNEEKKDSKEQKKQAKAEDEKESKTGTLKKTKNEEKKDSKEQKKQAKAEEEKESKTGTLKKGKNEEKKDSKEQKKQAKAEEEKESKTGTLKKTKNEEKKDSKEQKKQAKEDEEKESKTGTLKKQGQSEKEPKTSSSKKRDSKSEEGAAYSTSTLTRAKQKGKAMITSAENAISAAPEKAEKLACKLDTAASTAYLDTKEAISKPKELVKDAKKLAKSDMKKALSSVKENGRRFADEVDGTMQRVVAKSEEHFLPTSKQHLVDAERYVLRDFECDYDIKDVEVGKGASIHTICFNAQQKHWFRKRLPLVMIHGLGGGLPCFHKNYEHMRRDRNVYGIDLPGFALSSRVPFPKDPIECRNTIVALIEQWRKSMNIKKFILLGHSFGGHIAAAYAVRHSSRVRHLILADPWGIIAKEEDDMRDDPVLWQRAAMCISNSLKSNPFDVVRDTGPLGPILAKRFLPEQLKKAYGSDCSDYFYHALAQSNATGEGAFSLLSGYEYMWPADAMKPHLIRLTKSVPMTFIYGETSPFCNGGGTEIQRRRKNVFVHQLASVGHHVQAQDDILFNERMFEVLSKVDKKRDTCKKSKK